MKNIFYKIIENDIKKILFFLNNKSNVIILLLSLPLLPLFYFLWKIFCTLVLINSIKIFILKIFLKKKVFKYNNILEKDSIKTLWNLSHNIGFFITKINKNILSTNNVINTIWKISIILIIGYSLKFIIIMLNFLYEIKINFNEIKHKSFFLIKKKFWIIIETSLIRAVEKEYESIFFMSKFD